MRGHPVAAVVVIALCMAGLTACKSNVGAAATIQGHRITESDVAKYMTVNAEPVPQQDPNTGATTNIPARAWILRALLDTELYADVLRKTPDGMPTEGELATAQTELLQGTSVDQVADQYDKHGYQRAFARVYLRLQALEQILGSKIQGGLDAQKILDDLHLSISVNPRYGSWDAKTFQLASDPAAGRPDFLKVSATYTPPSTAQPSPTASG